MRDAVIAGRRYSPEGARGTIVWLHGGGWVFDGLEAGDAMCRILANSAGADVVAIDYRVAPSTGSRCRWMTAGTRCAGWPSTTTGRWCIGGDSAGGNMSAVCALRARDARRPAADSRRSSSTR